MQPEDYKAIAAQIPTEDLLKLAKDRNKEARQKYGRYGAQKKISRCGKCGLEGGVRELRKHKCQRS